MQHTTPDSLYAAGDRDIVGLRQFVFLTRPSVSTPEHQIVQIRHTKIWSMSQGRDAEAPHPGKWPRQCVHVWNACHQASDKGNELS
jgi:hypothetical protein